jgi:hypothetical protein
VAANTANTKTIPAMMMATSVGIAEFPFGHPGSLSELPDRKFDVRQSGSYPGTAKHNFLRA